MEDIKSQSLCVLEDTDAHTVYLTGLVRIVQNEGDELCSYAGGDELFLRCETWTVLKEEGGHTIQGCSILHVVPERVATPDGGNCDTAVLYVLTQSNSFYKNGEPDGHAEPSGKWACVGLAGGDGIYAKIVGYFDGHRDKIAVRREDIE